jgi:hypothetical protein
MSRRHECDDTCKPGVCPQQAPEEDDDDYEDEDAPHWRDEDEDLGNPRRDR